MTASILTLSRPGSRGRPRVVEHTQRGDGRLLCGFVPERYAPADFAGIPHVCRNCQRLGNPGE